MTGLKNTPLPPVPWKAADVAIGIGLAVAGLVVVGGIYVLVRQLTDQDLNSGSGFAIIGGAGYAVVLAASWVMGPVRYRTSPARLGLKLPNDRGSLQLLLPVLVLVVSLVLTAIYAGIISLMGWELPDALPEELEVEGSGVIGTFILVAFWGPLAEEVFFRGFVFAGLVGSLGVRWAAVASSLLFAVVHGEPWVMAPIFVTGLLLTWLYVKTGSLWSPFAAHAMQNALVFSVSAWA